MKESAPQILDLAIGIDASGTRQDHYAIEHDLTLKEAALANGVSGELFNRVVDPLAMTRAEPAGT